MFFRFKESKSLGAINSIFRIKLAESVSFCVRKIYFRCMADKKYFFISILGLTV